MTAGKLSISFLPIYPRLIREVLGDAGKHILVLNVVARSYRTSVRKSKKDEFVMGGDSAVFGPSLTTWLSRVICKLTLFKCSLKWPR